jgi:hypothetical protein
VSYYVAFAHPEGSHGMVIHKEAEK